VIKNLIEKHLVDYVTEDSNQVRVKNSTELITWNRLDLAIKIFFLETEKMGLDYAQRIYASHIKSFGLGQVREPGNDNKNSILAFIKEFLDLVESTKTVGFDASRSLIPLDGMGTIVNGAHRIAACYYNNVPVSCVTTSSPSHIYDFRFFLKRGLPRTDVELAACKFTEYCANPHIAIVWPAAKGNNQEIENLIPNVYYYNSIKITRSGRKRLISQVYYSEEWLGDVNSVSSGVAWKAHECFKSETEIRVYAFYSDSLSDVVELKEKIRELFGTGKHSVHITDTKSESVRISRILFNSNSIHYINYSSSTLSQKTYSKIEKFKSFCDKQSLSLDNVVLDTGLVLELYGVRDAHDIDFISFDHINIHSKESDISDHSHELKWHGLKKSELIYNPSSYFYFDDVKFVSLSQVLRMKKNRLEPKDRVDIKDIVRMIDMPNGNLVSEHLERYLSSIIFFGLRTELRLRGMLISILRILKIYPFARFCYRTVFRK
jgi:hypothetical protein